MAGWRGPVGRPPTGCTSTSSSWTGSARRGRCSWRSSQDRTACRAAAPGSSARAPLHFRPGAASLAELPRHRRCSVLQPTYAATPNGNRHLMINPERLTVKSAEALNEAIAEARRNGNPQVYDTHLLLVLLAQDESIVLPVLQKLGVNVAALRESLAREIGRYPKQTDAQPTMARELTAVLDQAEKEAKKLGDEYVSTEHLLLALADARGTETKSLLSALGATHKTLLQALQAVRGTHKVTDQTPENQYQALQKYTRDLTEDARNGKLDPVIGRDEEIRRVIQVLSRRTKNNPVLIGEPGVGKTAIVEGLAQRIVNGDVPESLKPTIAILRGLKERYEAHHGIRITDGAVIAAATLSHRYIADRFLPDKAIDLLDEAASKLRIEIDSMPQEIDEVERRIMQLEIERTALQKEKDPASVERRQALEKELAELKEKASAINAQWQQEKETLGTVGRIKQQMVQARIEAEQASRRGDLAKAAEITYGQIPELERQLKEAESKLASAGGRPKYLKEEVTEEDIAEVVARWTGIPVTRMLEGERERLTKLDKELAKRVIGQQEAVEAVANAVRRSRAGLQDPNRPIGSFIFLGPTGVGKTETARALAEFLFDDEHSMVRIDMSEYMEKHAVARLIGAPPGYVGYEEGGQLTEAVRRRPYSVILLDEVEKAHPDVWNIMLQIFDDGRLTDGKGRTVDFKNTVIIMTSNIAVGGDSVRDALRAHFKPEFLNRIDDIIIFKSLGKEEISKIIEIQLENLRKHLADRKITLELSPAAREALFTEGYDPSFGARPLKRAIQKLLADPLALKILEGDIQPGEHLVADVSRSGEFSFRPGTAVPS